MLLPLDSLRTDGGTQPRGMIDFSIVEEYAGDMQAGAEFPPVVVFYDGTDHWLADGFHRAKAAREAGREEIACDVRQGTRSDAVWYSCGANQGHGLRRTNADKRRAVETALRLKPDSSDRAIAEHCGVHNETVAAVRREIAPAQLTDSVSSKRIGKDGKARSLPQSKPRHVEATKLEPVRDESRAEVPDLSEFHVPAPVTTAPKVEASFSVTNKRDRLVAEVVALGPEHARWVCNRVLRYLESSRV